jgi:uncharacterized protein
MTLTTATWSLIFLGAVSLWWPPLRRLSLALLTGGYALALVAGFLDGRALVVIAVLITLAWMIRPERSARWRVPAHILFVLLAVALALHVVPGFHNLQVIEPVRFTPDAVPFTMYLNLDKPLAGYWLLLVWPALALRRDGSRGLLRGVGIGAVTAAVCLGLGVALGAATYAPKWPDLGWLWALNNLLLVCMTEEAVFRGYLQESLSRRFHESRYEDVLAIGVASILFGAAHFAGGAVLIALSTIAGVGYGLAYRIGGLQAAVLAHFGLNLAHFTLFTYPMLAG